MKKLYIAILAIASSSRTIPSRYCTCENILSQEICLKSIHCAWINAGCETHLLECFGLPKKRCLTQSNCYWSKERCETFTDCSSLGENCNRYTDRCFQVDQNCLSLGNCTQYYSEKECNHRSLHTSLCFWNGSKCEDVTDCQQLPASFSTDEMCRKEMQACSLSASGNGCQLSGLNCSDHTIEKQCNWNRNQSQGCIWNYNLKTCTEKACDSYPFGSHEECLMLGCLTNGFSCISKQNCSSYNNELSCKFDSLGKPCVYYQNQCYPFGCQFAPSHFLSLDDCQNFGPNCTPMMMGGCKDHQNICESHETQSGCLFSSSCIWFDQHCRSWKCSDSSLATQHTECLVFNCVGKISGGCQERPQSCLFYQNDTECAYGSSSSQCLWFSGGCIERKCDQLFYPQFNSIQSCQEVLESCIYKPYLGCSEFQCQYLSKPACLQHSNCNLSKKCFLKTAYNAPLYFSTHEQCVQWSQDATVGRLGGCIKKSLNCADYSQVQCHETLQNYLCKWHENKCQFLECADLNFSTDPECQEQKLTNAKCQLNSSGDGCIAFTSFCQALITKNYCKISQQIDLDSTQPSPVFYQRVTGAQTEYGFGFWLRLLVFYPKILTSNGYQNQPYLVSRLSDNEGLTDGYGDRTLAILLGINNYQFWTYNIDPVWTFSSQTVAFPSPRLDGLWTQIYMSYKGDGINKVSVCVKFGSEVQQWITTSNIQHQGVPQLTFIFGGNDQGRYKALNGYFKQVVLGYGPGSYVDSSAGLASKMDNYEHIVSLVFEKALFFFSENVNRNFNDDGTLASLQVHNADLFPSFYSVGGWFKWAEPVQVSAWNNLFRVRQTPNFLANLGYGDRLIALFYKRSESKLFVTTYSYSNIRGLSGDSNLYEPITTNNKQYSWFYFYSAYSRDASILYIKVVWHGSLSELAYANVNHLYSKFFYIFVGNDNLYHGFQGSLAYFSFSLGEDQFNRQGQSFNFDQSKINNQGSPIYQISIEEQSCLDSDSSDCGLSNPMCSDEVCLPVSCEMFSYTNDQDCMNQLSNYQCRTNGMYCVQRGSCESVSESEGCTFSLERETCIWINSGCFLKDCNQAPLLASTLQDCQRFFPQADCIPRKSGGCKTRGRCTDIETNDSCSSDKNGQSCIWIQSACVDQTCQAICGDGILEPEIEECDDGNQFHHDGCYQCKIECSQGCLLCEGLDCYTCNEAQGWYLLESDCKTRCGDGIVAGEEYCDDGNLINFDGCSEVCSYSCQKQCESCFEGICMRCASGWTLQQGMCISSCGDGFKASDEACDDGNEQSFDGCTNCRIDNEFECIEDRLQSSICEFKPKVKLSLTEITDLRQFHMEWIQIQFSSPILISGDDIFIFQFYNLTQFTTKLHPLGRDFVLEVSHVEPVLVYILNVTVKSGQIFDAFGRPISEIYDTIKLRPKQFALSDQQSVENGINYTIQRVFTISVIIGLIHYFMNSPEIIWGLIQILQEISYLYYINFEFPSNLESYFKQFQIFQFKHLLGLMGLSADQYISLHFNLPHIQSLGKLKDLNALLVSNIDCILIALSLGYFFYFAAFQMNKLIYSYKIFDSVIIAILQYNSFRPFIKRWFEMKRSLRAFIIKFPYSGPLKLFIVLLYDIYFALFLQLVSPSNDTAFKSANYATSIALLILSIFQITCVQKVMQLNYQGQLYADLIQGYDDTKSYKRQYQTCLVVTRLFYMQILIHNQENPIFQSYTISLLFQCCFLRLLYVKPFRKGLQNLKIAYSQACIFICALTFPLYGLSWISENQQIYFSLGWIHVGLLSSIILLNFCVDLLLLLQRGYQIRAKHKRFHQMQRQQIPPFWALKP